MCLAWGWGLARGGERRLWAQTGLADLGLGRPLAGGWVGEKGSPCPTLSGSPSWDFWSGRIPHSPRLAPTQQRWGALGGVSSRVEEGGTMAGICLSVGGEPYPSSITTCA